MASGSLPPGFPAALIEGEYYWDGGLISNTALQWVVDKGPRQDTLAFQVDLWSARGELPRNLAEVATRLKEIQYSSRTRAKTAILSRGDRLERRLDRTGGSVIGASRLSSSRRPSGAGGCFRNPYPRRPHSRPRQGHSRLFAQ
jgi:predicted acylesterase/phospholipase RssA